MIASSWHLDQYVTTNSIFTNRPVYVNKSEKKFLIPPTFDAEIASKTAQKVFEFMRVHRTSRSVLASPSLRRRLEPFASVKSVPEFGGKLDLLLDEVSTYNGVADKARLSDLLVALWWAGCLAFPRDGSPHLGKMYIQTSYWGEDDFGRRPQELVDRFLKTSSAHSRTKSLQARALMVVMLGVAGLKDVGDLTPDIADGRFANLKIAPSITATLVSMIREMHGSDAEWLSFQHYGPFGRKATRSDNGFQWAHESDAALEAWATLAEEFLSQQLRNVTKFRTALNCFFDLLIAHPDLPRDPLVFVSSATSLPVNLNAVEVSDPVKHGWQEFFDWVLATRCTAEDDNGHPYRLPGFRNPLTKRLQNSSRHIESVRDAMPTRYVRRLREIIEENDFHWPRTAFEPGTDTFRWRDAATGEWRDIFSPVRALAILMKLEIPERTFQVRVCNSGEADPERYDRDSNSWVVNTHPLAGQTPYGQPMGLARQIRDIRANRVFTGLYFNTNKTGDIGKDPEDRGHVVPWENQRVLEIYDRLRRWQEKYNPIIHPTPWLQLREDAISKRYSADILRSRGAETFLFRDPCSAYPNQPVAATRLVVFWNKLCAELERRLAEEGETAPGGGPITLVTRNKTGNPTGTQFTLHSLRVTMITAWAEAGVPIEILMKVAGHATVIMTLYYTKQTVAHITDILNAASADTMRKEQENWQAWLRSKSYDNLEPLIACNDIAGRASFADAPAISIVRRDHGICPVGCSRCHEGGPAIPSAMGTKKNAPVPGGPQNCVRCRFFITGPCFLLGLSAHFDDIGLRYREASKRYVEVSGAFERLDYLRKQAASQREPFTRHSELEILSSTLDQRTREVDEFALTWHATYNLIEQSLALLRNPNAKDGDEGKTALITVGSGDDLDFALELDERGEREFELLDKICQSSVFFSSIDPSVPNLKRMRRFDSFLTKSGYEPAFIDMSEEEALAAGNEFSRFLYTRFGRETVNRLVNGEQTLRSLGVEVEARITGEVAAITGRRLERAGRTRLIDVESDVGPDSAAPEGSLHAKVGRELSLSIRLDDQ